MVAGTLLGWLGSQWRLVQARKGFNGQALADGGYAASYFVSQVMCTSDDYPGFHETEWQTPSIPFWRRWLGDEPVGLVVVPAAWPESEAQRAKSLFPESPVYWRRQVLSLPPSG